MGETWRIVVPVGALLWIGFMVLVCRFVHSGGVWRPDDEQPNGEDRGAFD
jgi:hypothetical protein